MRVTGNHRLRKWLYAAPLLVGSAALVHAQIEGPRRGIPPIASTGDFEVTDIAVNTTGKNADEARRAGWQEAQRKAWSQLWARTHGGGGAELGDDTLDGIVSAIIVQQEQIGPRRYIARLGVSFDRARAGQLLGIKGIGTKSAPMLVIPIMISGGAEIVFERQTPWQAAWAKFRTADSRIDYVRPFGGGSESLLLNAGQMDRRSRSWWRVILDQFGAADVIYPIVRLERQWPGGPVIGKFSARFGPENRYLGSFTLRADDSNGVPAMLNEGLVKMDQLFQQAFLSGRLRAEAALLLEDTIDQSDLEQLEEDKPLDPLQNLVDSLPDDSGRGKDGQGDNGGPGAQTPTPAIPTQTTTISVQVNTPTPEAVDRAEAAIRGIPGVRSVVTTSLALGGTSVLRVTYQGDPAALQSALSARGIR